MRLHSIDTLSLVERLPLNEQVLEVYMLRLVPINLRFIILLKMLFFALKLLSLLKSISHIRFGLIFFLLK